MKILAIETSCDETSAAVVVDGRRALSNVIASQIDLHRRYGGVMPEMASRQHVLAIAPVIEQAMGDARTTLDEVDALAVTKGPGLAGSLLVGVNTAKALAFGLGKPLVGVNHIESHIYANWLIPGYEAPSFPLVCLVVSGGHSELILMKEHLKYKLLGKTRDDAAGEAFDKVARILGLGYPGGPAIDAAARMGDSGAVQLPRAWLKGTFDFSFSGLKTAVLHKIDEYRTGKDRGSAGKAETSFKPGRGEPLPSSVPVNDIAAAFQLAVVDVLTAKAAQAAEKYQVNQVLVAGGVAANSLLRQMISERIHVPVYVPPLSLCTDNAAMVGAAGYFRYVQGERADLSLDVEPSLRLIA